MLGYACLFLGISGHYALVGIQKIENLDSGQRCWKLRRLDRRDEDGTPVSTRGVFLQVIADCLVA